MMLDAPCTRCQHPMSPYRSRARPVHPDWCRRCNKYARQTRYEQSVKGRANRARTNQRVTTHMNKGRYQQSAKGRAAQARYAQSLKGRANQARYAQSEHGRTARQQYEQQRQQTEQGRVLTRANAMRYYSTEHGRARLKQYRQSAEGRDVCYRIKAMRRARVARAAIIEPVSRQEILRLDDLCHLCDIAVDPANFHLDHVIPIAVHPIEAQFNYAVAHPRCNQSKNAHLGYDVLSPTARARWQMRRPADLAQLDAHFARILEKAAA